MEMNVQTYYVIEYGEVDSRSGNRSYIGSFKPCGYAYLSFPEVNTTVGTPFNALRLSKEKADEIVTYLTLIKQRYARVVEIETISRVKENEHSL